MNVPTFYEWLSDLYDDGYAAHIMSELSERRTELLEMYTHQMLQRIANEMMGGR